jgi:hypothetical protein
MVDALHLDADFVGTILEHHVIAARAAMVGINRTA